MISRREGAAIRQDHRSNSIAARSRKPGHSIPAWADDEEWGTGKTIAAIMIGTPILYALMWLAAAY